jgi:cytochrome c oxidase assembly protein Cox11
MPESIDCTPNALLEASKCFCFPEQKLRDGAMIYLMLVISGLNLTPKQLLEASKCYCFGDQRAARDALLYLTCAAANAASS